MLNDDGADMLRRLALLSLLAAPYAVPAQAAEPSFDCAEATGVADRMICTDPMLSMLDRRAAQTLEIARTGVDEDQAAILDDETDAWVVDRGTCEADAHPHRCLRDYYARRIASLRSAYPSELDKADGTNTVGPVAFACDDLAETVEATFLNGATPLVALVWGDHDMTLPQVVAASGNRYEEGRMMFWTKGGHAMFAFPSGTTLECTALD